MKILLSGFGKFSGVDINPTNLIINALQQENWVPNRINKDEFTTRIVDVHTIGCDNVLTEFMNDIKLSNSREQIILFIHLGVDSGSNTYKLEMSAYNNMTFRCPDENGYAPVNKKIKDSYEFDEALQTSLPTDIINVSLQNSKFCVIPSNDPGRFICNYIYYQALVKCQELQQKPASTQMPAEVQEVNNHSTSIECGISAPTDDKLNSCRAYALFIHVPSANVFSIPDQCEFVKSTINTIVANVTNTDS